MTIINISNLYSNFVLQIAIFFAFICYLCLAHHYYKVEVKENKNRNSLTVKI